jgi:ABC-type transport system substrate-binding protein
MRLPACAWLALSSFLFFPLDGATRPRYGGTLVVDLSTPITSLDPSESPLSLPLPIAETLVRLNSRGEIEPQLAVAWQREAAQKRWRISLRPKVVFHDGEVLTAVNAVPSLLAALKKKYGDINITAGGQTIVIQSDRALPDLLTDLASPRAAIFRKAENGSPIGTGPFRVSSWEPGRRITLSAFEDYWGGRPFLDSVVINTGASRGRSDIFDVPFTATRRILPEGTRIWSSRPDELIALVSADVQPVVWQALALAIDRPPIVNVLTERRGEAAYGLLPQWLSGYAFLFQTAPDAARARQMIAQLRLNPLTLSYPGNDSLAKSMADRIALNARDVGITLQPVLHGNGNLRLIRWPFESVDAATELTRVAAMLGASERSNSLDAARPEALYELERALLDTNRLIPLLFLPAVYGLNPRVHDGAQKNDSGALHLETIWVDP